MHTSDRANLNLFATAKVRLASTRRTPSLREYLATKEAEDDEAEQRGDE